MSKETSQNRDQKDSGKNENKMKNTTTLHEESKDNKIVEEKHSSKEQLSSQKRSIHSSQHRFSYEDEEISELTKTEIAKVGSDLQFRELGVQSI